MSPTESEISARGTDRKNNDIMNNHSISRIESVRDDDNHNDDLMISDI